LDTAVTLHLEQFEGPLELLLHLITKNRVDITDIPVALICDQYLEYLREMERLDMEIASSFIVMAAQLILLKTRTLLPVPEEEEAEDPRAALVEALLEYKRIKAVSGLLDEAAKVGIDRIPREPVPLNTLLSEPKAGIEYRNKPEDLIRALRRMTARENRRDKMDVRMFDKLVGAEPAPVEERVARALEKLAVRRRLPVREMCHEARNRSELVAVFLAVLELLNQRKAVIDGEDGSVAMLPETTAEANDNTVSEIPVPETEEKQKHLGKPGKQLPAPLIEDIRERTLITPAVPAKTVS